MGGPAGGRSLRRYRDDRVHARLEVARDVAEEEVGAGLGEIDRSRLRLPRVDVVAVADEGDAGAVLDDVAVLVDREGRRGKVALEDQQLVLDGPEVRGLEVDRAGLDRAGHGDVPLAQG